MGNTALKAIEGTAKVVKLALKEAFMKNIFTKIKAVIASGLINKALVKYDYTKYGGAVLLGVRKPVIKIHGNAKALNYEKAIIVSGDGDFYCLIEYLNKKNKLFTLLSQVSSLRCDVIGRG